MIYAWSLGHKGCALQWVLNAHDWSEAWGHVQTPLHSEKHVANLFLTMPNSNFRLISTFELHTVIVYTYYTIASRGIHCIYYLTVILGATLVLIHSK